MYQNKNHNTDVKTTALNASLSLEAGQVGGLVLSEVHDKNSWDYTMHVQVDLTDGTLHDTLDGNGKGKTTTNDTTITSYADGVPVTEDTLAFAQNGTTGSTMKANGSLGGKAGTWKADGKSSGRVNDSTTVTTSQLADGAPEVTDKHFNLDRFSRTQRHYHEEGDLLLPSGRPGSNAVSNYVQDVSATANKAHTSKGTPSNYEFTDGQGSAANDFQ